MFDMFKDLMNPEMLLDVLMRGMSPMQRQLITGVPKLVKSTYDMTKRPAPTCTVVRQGSDVYVKYAFASEDDATAFEESERATLDTIDKILKAIAEQPAGEQA